MRNIENMFYATDFSRHTDLKSRLAERLFGSASSAKVTAFPFHQLNDDDMDLVNAALGIRESQTDPTDQI